MKEFKQVTSTILMVRPAYFTANPETAEDNHFQREIKGVSINETTERAQKEFDRFVETLRSNGITVYVHQDDLAQKTSDAVFPNNWVTFHCDGTVITYPMFAPSRRMERNLKVIDTLVEKLNLYVSEIIDLSVSEKENKFLEGTGSLIIDRPGKITYAAISERTTPELLEEFGERFGYKVVKFTANQSVGNERLPIYHTNVMMCLGEKFAVICLDTIDDTKERVRITETILNSGKEIVEITEEQVEQFAGNMLQVKNDQEESILVMSSQAYHSLRSDQINTIEKYSRILHSDISTIETLGGGSARCMMAEVFLPNK